MTLYIHQGLIRDKAIKLSIKECIEENILKEFLTENSKKVFNMLTAEYDMDTALRIQKEEGIKEGIQKGIEKEKIEMAKKLVDILDIQTISKLTGLSIEIIQELASSKDDIHKPYMNKRA